MSWFVRQFTTGEQTIGVVAKRSRGTTYGFLPLDRWLSNTAASKVVVSGGRRLRSTTPEAAAAITPSCCAQSGSLGETAA